MCDRERTFGAGGAYVETRVGTAELGTVVIGGLLSSTFLTLIVVPAAYRLVEGLRNRDLRPDADAQAQPSPAALDA